MGMTPDEFFLAFVKANYDDCVEHPGCVRRAFNAAVSASQLADHYFAYFHRHDPSKIASFRNLGNFINHISIRTSGAFRDIRSISNAYKHLYTSTEAMDSGHASISSAGTIESIDLAKNGESISLIEEEWVKGTESDNSTSRVVFTRIDGQRIEFLPSLKSVVDYWSENIW